MKINESLQDCKMPYSKVIEHAIIGSIILESTAIEVCIDIGITDKMFYEDKMATIYKAALSLYNSGKKVDMILLSEELMGIVESYDIVELTMAISTAANLETHCRVLIQKYMKRRQVEIAYNLLKSGYDGFEDPDDSLAAGISEIEGIINQVSKASSILHISDVGDLSLTDIRDRKRKFEAGIKTGVTTGLADLDVMLGGGFQPANLIILAARPSMGKTAMAIKHARSAALQGVPVYFVSLEMRNTGIYNRLLLSECNVQPDKLKTGDISNFDDVDLSRAKDRLSGLPIYIDETPDLSIEAIKSRAKMLHRKGQCGVIICDYLGYVTSAENLRNRYEELGKITKGAKRIAKELDIPFVLLCQLNRATESRTDKKPQLADLRESGDIEQDADVVVMLYRPAYYGIDAVGENDVPVPKNTGVSYILKNRDGQTGRSFWSHNESLTKITDFGVAEIFDRPKSNTIPF